jgi:hypothetical protein
MRFNLVLAVGKEEHSGSDEFNLVFKDEIRPLLFVWLSEIRTMVAFFDWFMGFRNTRD